jgi:hypothetical protein
VGKVIVPRAAQPAGQLLRIDAELLEQRTMLLVVHLVGQLLPRLMCLFRTHLLLDEVHDSLLVQLHL